jgi:GntR family transcriptional regulator, transcriptional repressor for pyruvate dehydrogenase complex
MPIQAIEPQRLYRQIADQIRVLIRQGEFPVGTRLPAERLLSAQLGVSRPSLREAIIALEVEGLVEVRPGSGIHVVALESQVQESHLNTALFGPFEILRARHLIEGELAAAAAKHASPDLLKQLRAALKVMREDIENGIMPIRGDRLFHQAIAQAPGIGPLERTVTELFDERNNPLFEKIGQHFENDASWANALQEHQAVIDAIAAANPEQARRAMHEHLDKSQTRFADAWPSAEPVASAT